MKNPLRSSCVAGRISVLLTSPLAALLVVLLVVLMSGLLAPSPCAAQDYFTVTRRDEVGPRSMNLDEETFLNVLSFEQPLETLQPWLRDEQGFRTAFGSLDASTFYQEDDVKLYAPVTENFGVRLFGHRALDFDSNYLVLQAMLEFRLDEHFYFGIPADIDPDKGEDDAGLALGYRDAESGIDFLQVSTIWADPLFNHRSNDFPDSRVTKASVNYEFQFQVTFGDAGTTSGKIGRQEPTAVDFTELDHSEKFQRSTVFLLHSLDFGPDDRLFLRFDRDAALEESEPLGLGSAPPDPFDAQREYLRLRAEWQHHQAGDDSGAIRVGVEQLHFEERVRRTDASRILRRESFAYAGYRTAPISWLADADLETALFVGSVQSHNDIPSDPERDGRDEPFQSKLSFYLRWVGEKATFLLTPSIGLDRIHWGGGGAALRYRF